tara:strand:+ start:386 stop:1648 length:1263 start_codon:yes stop_codon:yes gene_type:complete
VQKIEIISFSLKSGGAGIAASKFKKLLIKNVLNYEVNSTTQDSSGKYQFFKRLISKLLTKLQFDGNPTKHSLNFFSFRSIITLFKKRTNDKLFHIHWINNDTLSIFDFHSIPSGSIITLHDEWLYCGSEHYYNVYDNSNDFIYGYRYFKKGIIGIHWNYLLWRIKYNKLSHRKDLIYTVPSRWMLERAKASSILKESNICLLPNPIDTEVFKKYSEDEIKSFRDDLNIDKECFVIVFGAISGKKNKLKGLDLLSSAFELLQSKLLQVPISKVVLVDFGGLKSEGKLFGFRNISLGHIKDPIYLAKLYCLADCVTVPSMVESFGQVAAEALSCCTPVVSFDTSGLKDIVLHKYNGLVAEPLSITSLCEQLRNIIESPKKTRLKLGENGRKHVLEKFSYPIIQKKYLNILEEALELSKIQKK